MPRYLRPKRAKPKKYGFGPAKRYRFTLGDYTEEECQKIEENHPDASVEYMIVGKEIWGEERTPRLQGFVHYKGAKRFSQVKELLGERCRVELARGTDEQNRLYCGKRRRVYLERGATSADRGGGGGGGGGSDVRAAVDVLEESGGAMTAVARRCPLAFVRHFGRLSAIRDLLRLVEPRFVKTKLTVLVGPPGVGKSKWAADEAGLHRAEMNVFYKNRGARWDGYFQQDVVIVDDFYGWIGYDDLLRLCDRRPLKVQIKGGMTEFTSGHIIITSNVHVNKWYKFRGFDASALIGRCDEYYDWKYGTDFPQNLMDSSDWRASSANALFGGVQNE